MPRRAKVNIPEGTIGMQEDESVVLEEMAEMNGTEIEVLSEDEAYAESEEEGSQFFGVDWDKYDFVSRYGEFDCISWKKEWLTFENQNKKERK